MELNKEGVTLEMVENNFEKLFRFLLMKTSFRQIVVDPEKNEKGRIDLKELSVDLKEEVVHYISHEKDKKRPWSGDRGRTASPWRHADRSPRTTPSWKQTDRSRSRSSSRHRRDGREGREGREGRGRREDQQGWKRERTASPRNVSPGTKSGVGPIAKEVVGAFLPTMKSLSDKLDAVTKRLEEVEKMKVKDCGLVTYDVAWTTET